MKKFVQPGDVVTLAMPYDRTSGQGVKVGNFIGICSGDALNTINQEVKLEGVFVVDKVSAQAWTQGVAIYWDDSAKNFTTTSSANTRAGIAMLAAANPSSTGTILLVPTNGA